MTIFLPTEPLSEDLIYDYRSYRWMGKGRDETIQLLLSDYADELEDVETRTFVMLGIAKALARKQEMTPAAASAAVTAIDDLIGLGYYRGAKAERVLETRRLLEKGAYSGPEAPYPVKKYYVPDWQIGDTFAHKIQDPVAEQFGISGHYVLFRLNRIFRDRFGAPRILAYVSLCPPEKLPKTAEELESLGYLGLYITNGDWCYQASLDIPSQRQETFWALEKIGCWPNVAPPEKDGAEKFPYGAHPLWGRLNRTQKIPDYEESICRCYRRYKKRRTKE